MKAKVIITVAAVALATGLPAFAESGAGTAKAEARPLPEHIQKQYIELRQRMAEHGARRAQGLPPLPPPWIRQRHAELQARLDQGLPLQMESPPAPPPPTDPVWRRIRELEEQRRQEEMEIRRLSSATLDNETRTALVYLRRERRAYYRPLLKAEHAKLGRPESSQPPETTDQK
jgi:hypothetical protein